MTKRGYMKTEIILIYIAVAFAGFAIGRAGHILGGQLKAPHHWIYGVVLIAVGMISFFFFYEDRWSLCLIAFGLGLAISDLDDMMALKFYGVDDVEVKRFWGID